MKKVRTLIATLLVGSMLATSTGCFGKFSLTQKLWGFNNSLGNKFLSTLLFWVFGIFQVYEISLFIDIVVFNLVEFWTGTNPISMKDGETIEKVAEVNGQPVKLTFSNRGQDVTIEAGGKLFSLHVDETVAVLRNGEGQVINESRPLADGGLEVRNGSHEVLVSKTPSQARGWAQLLGTNTDVFVQQMDVERGPRVAAAR